MILPGNLQVASPGQTSSATANLQTSATILGSPGPNYRTRVWGVHAIADNTGQAPTNWYIKFIEGTVGTTFGMMSGGGFTMPAACFFPGGYPLPADTLVGLLLRSALVSM